MRLLPDTHLLLWLADDSPSLPSGVRELLEDAENEIMFSVASLWEVAIKFALGRSEFRVDPRVLRRGLLDSGYFDLPVTADHAMGVAGLPPIHKDPFDRLLVAQASAEGLLLLTADPILARYPGPIRKV